MPAAAVIPAPLAYTIIVAVKRLVVGLNNKIFNYVLFFFDKYNLQTHTHTKLNMPLKKDLKTYNITNLLTNFCFNTVNKSECIKHVFFECALNVLSWDVAL